MTKKAFAVCAHPDDIEFMMAGTLIQLQGAGYEIHYMTIANGSCGTVDQDVDTIVRIRRQEALDATSLIGAIYHESLCNDLEIFYDLPLLRRLSAVMREVAPDIVLTHPPRDYMEDHMNACRLAVTAAFGRGIRNFRTEPERAPVDNPLTLYHAMPIGLRDPLGRRVYPGLYVDISDVIETKRQMLARHRSQKEWLDASQGIDSYLQHMLNMSREMGEMSGRYRYAEGWTRHLHYGFCEPDDDPLAEALPHLTLLVPET